MRTQTAGGRKDVIYCLSLSSAGVASARMSQTSRPRQTPKEPSTSPRHLWRSRATRNLARHDLERPPENDERWQRAQFYYEIQPVPTQASAQTHFVFLPVRCCCCCRKLRESWERSERLESEENEVTQQAKAALWR